MTETYPEAGARFVLELISDSADDVRYRAIIYVPAARYDYTLTLNDEVINLEPAGQLPPEAAPVPGWAGEHLRALARQLLRGGAPWPRRLSRWRPQQSG